MIPRIVFMGSSMFSATILEELSSQYKVTGVITQADKPAGRGRQLASPPVKITATQLGIPLIQPQKLRDAEAFVQLEKWKPELIVVAAYGQILRQNVLDLPRFGCLNVHASLLPRWRGAAPIQAAIVADDKITGITIMQMDAGVDTGYIVSQRSLVIEENDDYSSLEGKLASLGANLLLETIPCYISGKFTLRQQSDTESTYAPMVKKEDGEINLNLTAKELGRRIRAYNPWPGTTLVVDNHVIKVLNAHAEKEPLLTQGSRFVIQRYPAIATQEGNLVIQRLQLPGKKPISGIDFLNGAQWWKTVTIS